MKALLSALFLFALPAITLAAADLSGKWSGTYDVSISDGGGTMKGRVYMAVTQTGSELTGTIGPDEPGQTPIRKGAIDGDKITFESQTEGPLMIFDLRLVDQHIRGDAKGQLEGVTIQAKVDMVRAE